MAHDALLVIGIFLAGFAIPAVLSAWSDGRSPRAAAFMVVIAGGLIATVAWTWPGGFSPGEVPGAFVRIAARFL